MFRRWINAIGGRKFVVAVAGVAAVVATNLGVPEAVAERITDAIVLIAGSYLAAEGVADVVSRAKAPAV